MMNTITKGSDNIKTFPQINLLPNVEMKVISHSCDILWQMERFMVSLIHQFLNQIGEIATH